MPARDEPEDGARGDHERGNDEDRGLGECAEVLRLPVSVRMADVGRAARNTDGEEGQKGGDEVRAGVGRLREQPEAARVDPRRELEHDEDECREDRDECGTPLGRHAGSVGHGRRAWLSFDHG